MPLLNMSVKVMKLRNEPPLKILKPGKAHTGLFRLSEHKPYGGSISHNQHFESNPEADWQLEKLLCVRSFVFPVNGPRQQPGEGILNQIKLLYTRSRIITIKHAAYKGLHSMCLHKTGINLQVSVLVAHDTCCQQLTK